MKTFTLKNVVADMETVKVKVPTKTNGRDFFATCYPWQVSYLATIWCYYCMAYEAATYMRFINRASLQEHLMKLSDSFYQRFVELVGGTPEEVDATPAQNCQILHLMSENDKGWENQTEYVRNQIYNTVSAMRSFMKANGMSDSDSYTVMMELHAL